MKLLNVTFNGEEEPEPTEFTVTIPLDQLAVIYAVVGHMAPKTLTNETELRWGDALSYLGDDVGSIFNMFYDDGFDDVIRMKKGRQVFFADREQA